jgi:hypothetical protein
MAASRKRSVAAEIVFLRGGLASAMEAIDALRGRIDELAASLAAEQKTTRPARRAAPKKSRPPRP